MLEALDLTLKLKRREWGELRSPLQRRLYALQQAAFAAGIPAVVLIEGWAGAGKGDAIRTLTYGLDPRGFQAWVMRRAAEQDRRYPWLRRFWLRFPARGNLAIFDTGWYGQVLTARVEGALRDDAGRAAYRDCLDMERALVDDGNVLVKIWLHISPEEQRTRLRMSTGETLRWPGSRADDWKQHRKYREYLPLVEEMLAQSDVPGLSWTLIPANNRYHAQWQVLQTIAQAFEAALSVQGLHVEGVSAPNEAGVAHATGDADALP